MKLKVPYPWVECCLFTKKMTFAQNISPSPLMCPEMPLYTVFQLRGVLRKHLPKISLTYTRCQSGYVYE
jgi:hypothetical protein